MVLPGFDFPRWGRLVAGLSLVLGAASVPAVAAVPGFTDVTAQAGLTFTHSNLRDTPGGEMLGGGTAGDFNGDGWPDLYIIDGGSAPDRLFINHQGTFVDEAAAWGLTDLHRGGGAAAGDYDRDGDLDIFVTTFGNLPGAAEPGYHCLYRNDGDHFSNVAAAAGVNFSAHDHPDGFSPVFGDYDLDGDLDLWIGGWFAGPVDGIFTATRLFRNEGDGTFVDVTEESGVLDLRTRGFSAIFADMDGDRYPELLEAADFNTSRFLHNNRNGTFTGVPFGVRETVDNGMGTALADFNRDGLQDWFVTSIYPGFHNFGPPGNRMWLNKAGKDLRMVDPFTASFTDGGWGWGASAIDFDNDGWVDLFHTDGWREQDIFTKEWFLDEPSYLHHNNGDGTFTEMALAMGIDDRQQGRGVIVLDYDRDGDLDIVNLSSGGDLHLFRNDLAGPDAHWLEIRLRGGDNPRITPNGRGTTVRIRASDGTTQSAQLSGHANYLGGNDLMVHFGLGAATSLERVSIDWSDGFSTVLSDIAADQLLEVSATKPYSHGPLVRGEQADLTVQGLRPGEEALFVSSTAGTGQGPCPPRLGGTLCVDLIDPTPLGSAIADAVGTAVLTITVPDPQGVNELFSQVVVERGLGGSASLKSNLMTAPLLGAPAGRPAGRRSHRD